MIFIKMDNSKSEDVGIGNSNIVKQVYKVLFRRFHRHILNTPDAELIQQNDWYLVLFNKLNIFVFLRKDIMANLVSVGVGTHPPDGDMYVLIYNFMSPPMKVRITMVTLLVVN